MSARRIWLKEEDDILKYLYQKKAVKKWSSIALIMIDEYGLQDISGKKCRERYHNHLNPALRKQEWTKEEEQRLLQLHRTNGNAWAVISRNFPGRTDNAVKNKFYSKMRKALKNINYFNLNRYRKRVKQVKVNFIYKLLQIIEEKKNQQSSVSQQIIEQARNLKDSIFAFENCHLNNNQSSLDKLMKQISLIKSHFLKKKKIKKLKKKINSDTSSLSEQKQGQCLQQSMSQREEDNDYDCSMQQKGNENFHFLLNQNEDIEVEENKLLAQTCHCIECTNKDFCNFLFLDCSMENIGNSEQLSLDKPIYPCVTLSKEEALLNPFSNK